MKIALVHYHLRRGGVTSVIMNQARALAQAGADLLIIAGEAPAAAIDFPFALVENLGYDQPQVNPAAAGKEAGAQKLAQDVLRVMDARWGAAADIVHVHNPLIQKNSLLIPALEILGGGGVRLLLQNHDLAEDFRPDVYSAGAEYPKDCHYAVINSRDYDCLNRAGLKTEGLHLIPNEVSGMTATPGMKRSRYLYPVRAIRRKNIGEALLLSLFIPKDCTVAITLPPSLKDSKKYEFWTAFSKSQNLPMEFAIGEKMSLADLLGSAISALSTSVKEGFGFSFLEPWTAGIGLVGRRIDYVCSDFENSGVRFDNLYTGLEIPKEYIDKGRLEQKMENTMQRIYEAFGSSMPSHIKQALEEDFVKSNTVDFGRLDEELQEAVIRKLCETPQEKCKLIDLNPILEKIGGLKDNVQLIAANRLAIEKSYGRQSSLELLLKIYSAVIRNPVVHKISKTALLDLYLDPRRLSLVGISDG